MRSIHDTSILTGIFAVKFPTKKTTLLIAANYLLQALRFRARFYVNATHHDPSLKKAHEAIYH